MTDLPRAYEHLTRYGLIALAATAGLAAAGLSTARAERLGDCPQAHAAASVAASTPATSTPVAVNGFNPLEEPLALRVDDRQIRQISQQNPEAAFMLQLMNHISELPDAPLPSQSVRLSDKLVSPAAVALLSERGVGRADISAFETAADGGTGNGDRSALSWALRKGHEQAFLRLTHQILNPKLEQVAAPYPDIGVSLSWVDTPTGGRWQATGWRVLPREL